MYSIYQIYQLKQLVLTTYHTFNTEYADQTKLDIILKAPSTNYLLADQYFKHKDQFTIRTVATNLSNALEANEKIDQLTNKTNLKPSVNEQLEIVKATPKPKRSRNKKALQSKTED